MWHPLILCSTLNFWSAYAPGKLTISMFHWHLLFSGAWAFSYFFVGTKLCQQQFSQQWCSSESKLEPCQHVGTMPTCWVSSSDMCRPKIAQMMHIWVTCPPQPARWFGGGGAAGKVAAFPTWKTDALTCLGPAREASSPGWPGGLGPFLFERSGFDLVNTGAWLGGSGAPPQSEFGTLIGSRNAPTGGSPDFLLVSPWRPRPQLPGGAAQPGLSERWPSLAERHGLTYVEM